MSIIRTDLCRPTPWLLVPVMATALACAGGGGGGASPDAGPACSDPFSASDAGKPATITIDTDAVVSQFVPKLLFGVNTAWYLSKRGMNDTQSKVQSAGNYIIRYPGGSSSDDYHWNGTGSYDASNHWVPDDTTYTAGFQGTEMYRGTTSAGYQAPALITDGNPDTRWLSNADTAFPDAQWVYVDLGATGTVDALDIVWGTPYATKFRVQTWSSTAAWPPPYQAKDGTWTDTSAGEVVGTGSLQSVTFEPVSTRFVRVLMSGSSGGAGAAYSIAELAARHGTTQVTKNVASTSQSATVVSSTDPASQSATQAGFDFESFMSYLATFTPAAEAVITVNVGTGTPQEAAAWVHYANVVKKYGIRYWQIGNEMEGVWETGGPLNAQDYVRRYIAYYDAMKAEDPGIVVLGPVSGGIGEPSNLDDGKTFIEDFIRLLAEAGKASYIEGIDFHWYPSYGNVSNQAGLATVSQLDDLSKNLEAWLSAAGAKNDVPVFLTEYNMGLGESAPPVYVNQLVNGLWTATMLGEYARLFGNGGATFLWNMLSGGNTPDATDPAAGDHGYLQDSNNSYRYQEHAEYWAMQLMSSRWAIAGDSRTHALVATTSSQSTLATYADRRPDGALTLAVINRDETQAASATITIAPFAVGSNADVWTFDARNYVWTTSSKPYHAEPDTAPTHALRCGASASTPYTFPPFSVTVIRFTAPGGATAVLPDAGPVGKPDTTVTHSYVLVDDMETTSSGPIQISMGDTGLEPGSWFGVMSTGSDQNTMAPEPYAFSDVPESHETMSGVTSRRAGHLTCTIADIYGYCQQGLTLVSPETPFDLSRYAGVVFWAKSSADNTVKFQIGNDDTIPDGGKCGLTSDAKEQCWDSFAKYLALTDTWKRFEVRFEDLAQDGWGHAATSGSFDASTARSLNFLVSGPPDDKTGPVTADFWIDDVYLIE
jgi:alpha-L-arabinofuranosidase